ncbi:KTSC domain-containing protein [Hyphomicrobium sulfonivorans]|uniref:KTSC domain-containing protein n=1 Tax=Hyphomicrobium sulfonivorans TaxID=121290 RepID=UPI0009FB1130|nr:KTSC domain-containing protein [Hyphomicrobium sulfonivorans]
MQYVNSSAIHGINWNAQTLNLDVIFTSGPRVYTYYDVPRWKYEGLLGASSKGSYFNIHIRDQHRVSW